MISEAVGPQFGFGLYIHWPFCSRICPYCDFNVYAAKDRDTAPLLSAIHQDIAAQADLLPDHPVLDSIFFGGGTPSLLNTNQIETLIQTAVSAFGLKTDAEITIEANPNDILTVDLGAWRGVGINRVSLGVQSLNDQALHFLGRDHDVHAARKAIDVVQMLFENHSLDFIYARPEQSLRDWQDELEEILRLQAPHLSLYELTIEEKTAFGRRAARGELIPAAEDDQADLYEITQDLCAAAGLPAYEVSNHASSSIYQSQHNSIYWNSGDWIGVGPGAHGRLTIEGARVSTLAPRRVEDYVRAPVPTQAKLPDIDIVREYIAMGLRPTSGLSLERLKALAGAPLAAQNTRDLLDMSLIRISDDQLSLTPSGRLLADRITAELAP